MIVRVLVGIFLVGAGRLCECRRTQVLPDFKLPTRASQPGRVIAIPDFIETCQNVSLPGVMRNLQIEVDRKTSVIFANADVELYRTIEKVYKMIIAVKSCEDATLASCQHFHTWRFENDICGMANLKNVPWTQVMEKLHPKFRCPIQAGNYTIRNGTADTKILEDYPFPQDKYFWRTHIEAFDKHSMIYCGDAGTRFYRVRKP